MIVENPAEDSAEDSAENKESETPEASSLDDGKQEKPTAEMLAALAKLQEKGADVSSSGDELEEELKENKTENTEQDVPEATADALSARVEKTPDADAAGRLGEAGKGGSAQIIYVAKHDALGRAYATGKRKNSIVRVWIKPGQGNFSVNGRELEKYFARGVLCMIVKQPFEVTKCENSFDVLCTAKGGGLSGQAGALKHGISRALCNFDPQFRPALKNAGFLTRDARIVERKKYGKPKARRSFQFSKR